MRKVAGTSGNEEIAADQHPKKSTGKKQQGRTTSLYLCPKEYCFTICHVFIGEHSYAKKSTNDDKTQNSAKEAEDEMQQAMTCSICFDILYDCVA